MVADCLNVGCFIEERTYWLAEFARLPIDTAANVPPNGMHR